MRVYSYVTEYSVVTQVVATHQHGEDAEFARWRRNILTAQHVTMRAATPSATGQCEGQRARQRNTESGVGR